MRLGDTTSLGVLLHSRQIPRKNLAAHGSVVLEGKSEKCRLGKITGMGEDRVVHQMRSPVADRASTPVERVRADHRIANGKETQGERLTIDDVLAEAIEQARHHVHASGDGLGAAVHPRSRCHEVAGRFIEDHGVGESLAQFVIIGRCRERDRERVVVADEDAVLHVSEIAADRSGARRIRLTGLESIEA